MQILHDRRRFLARARCTPLLTCACSNRLISLGVVGSRSKICLRRLKGTVPSSVVRSDPDILGGTPVFVGTRVPVQALIDYIEGGHR
jgi:hypothetical protein